MIQSSKKTVSPEKTAAIHALRAVWNDRWMVPGICIFLAAITWLVFSQTLDYKFVNLDDGNYVYQNQEVNKGLTLEGITWAFTHSYSSNWHPLTWISHMLDCQFYGLNPGGHHLTNILLHMATVILLFLVLRQMTGALWRSAFVAAVFAIHPLRAESVAWVAERKDVLSGVFFMLTIGAYVRYARGLWSPARYGLVVFLFALGLMCKPMLVTLPFVLLLLDYWPLNRFRPDDAVTQPVFQLQGWWVPRRLVYEKLPLLGLVVASCVATLFAQSNAIKSFDQISLPLRVGNGLVSCVTYVSQMFWPSGLAVFYPYPLNGGTPWNMILAPVLLLSVCAGVFCLRKTRPYLLVGWLWYLVMLAPVIGILQVGAQAHADRYTYLPQIGLYLLLTWMVADLCAGWRHRRMVLGGLSTVILGALIFYAHAQTAYWRNSESLWTHTLACTSDNYAAHACLGMALFQNGNPDEAIVHYQQALQISPDFADAHFSLGNALLQKGNVDEAIAHYQRSLEIKPGVAQVYYNLGNALFQRGNLDEAADHYQQALQISPDFADAHFSLGNALLQKGNVDEAIVHYQQGLQIKPGGAQVYYNLGNALFQRGNLDEAADHYQQALQIRPDFAEAHNNLGLALCQKGRVDDGIIHFQKAVQINPSYPDAHNNLGHALLQKGNVDEAIVQYQQALQIRPDLAEANNNLGLALLQKGRIEEAITNFQQALQMKPDSAEAHYNLGYALLEKGSIAEAIIQFQKALQTRPDYQEALNDLAWSLATSEEARLRDGTRAVQLAERACELSHYQKTIYIGTLAAAYAEAGRFDEAMATAQKACALAEKFGQQDLLTKNRLLLELYRAHKPYRDVPAPGAPAAP